MEEGSPSDDPGRTEEFSPSDLTVILLADALFRQLLNLPMQSPTPSTMRNAVTSLEQTVNHYYAKAYELAAFSVVPTPSQQPDMSSPAWTPQDAMRSLEQVINPIALNTDASAPPINISRRLSVPQSFTSAWFPNLTGNQDNWIGGTDSVKEFVDIPQLPSSTSDLEADWKEFMGKALPLGNHPLDSSI
ncbi:hypothetical protein BT69DRAFT_87777 [Atractiella rhizophila]|nr:hypothetical protein BT69DRAFT_87777 [Atractiella rhizophila]